MPSSHLSRFHDLPVFDLPFTSATAEFPAADTVAWRLCINWSEDEDFKGIWQRFLDTVDTSRVTALIIGAWSQEMYDETPIRQLEAVIEAAPAFPALRAFFLADVVSEENEISWIQQTDITPLLDAYPALEELGARGGHREFTPVRHSSLRKLRLESGGMSAAVVRGISESELPALESLELWLGADEYGGDTTVGDLAPLLSGTRFPALRHLGLQDSEIQDEIAAAVAHAPVVPTLESLALSMGVLTDAGAEALLSGQPLTHLRRLDLSHHYISDAMMERLRETLEAAGVEVDLSEQETPDEFSDGELWYSVAVSE